LNTASAAWKKQDVTGNINYEPLNHENMVRIRAAKVEAIVQDIPDIIPAGDPDGDLLIVAWGSTHGAITAAVKAQRELGHRIGHAHLRHLNPLPANLGEVLKRYKTVLVPELNMGQLLWVLRAKYLVNATGLNKIQGRPFKAIRTRAEDRRTSLVVCITSVCVVIPSEARNLSSIAPMTRNEKWSTVRHDHGNTARPHKKRLPNRPGNPLVPRLR